jgi:hypothetical protein
MLISEPPTWLREEPRHSLIANRIFPKGWLDLANFFLLPGRGSGRAAGAAEANRSDLERYARRKL